MNTITQQKLHNIFTYDDITGIFTKKENNKIMMPQTNRKYARIFICKKEYSYHRLVWLYHNGEFPKNQIDHIDHNTMNNRIENLRDVTHKENHKNKTMLQNNTSGCNGIDYVKPRKKWRARITDNGIRLLLGHFKNKEDAIRARVEANKKLNFHPNHGL